LNNYKLTLAYQGTDFCGFQFQPGKKTVENNIVEALKKVFKKEIKITAAGRTDSGVHAQGQVINFFATQTIVENNLKKALNSILDHRIIVKHVELVDQKFNARRSAKSRVYKYLFSSQEVPLYLADFIPRIRFKPKISTLNKLSETLCGTHDFINFRNTGSQEKNTLRTMHACSFSQVQVPDIYQDGHDFVYFELVLQANAFLYKMVRNIAGALFEVLKGKQTLDSFAAMLANKSTYRYTTALAKGVCLVQVLY
jgi:tRNA pseudouridine38-40 synthase